MDIKKINLEGAEKLAKPYCVKNGVKVGLTDSDPGDAMRFQSEDKPRVANDHRSNAKVRVAGPSKYHNTFPRKGY